MNEFIVWTVYPRPIVVACPDLWFWSWRAHPDNAVQVWLVSVTCWQPYNYDQNISALQSREIVGKNFRALDFVDIDIVLWGHHNIFDSGEKTTEPWTNKVTWTDIFLAFFWLELNEDYIWNKRRI